MPGTAGTWDEVEPRAQPAWRRPVGLLVGAGVLVVLGVGAFLVRHNSAPPPVVPVAAASSVTTSTVPRTPSRTTATTAPPVVIQTTAPPDTPTTSATAAAPAGAGAADISLVAGDPRALGVGQTFTAYFTAIDTHQYGEAYKLYSDAYRGSTPESRWEAGLRSTQDGKVSVQQVADGSNGAVLATVQFTSHQDPADAPDHTSTCTVWNLRYTLLPGGNGVPYQIDSNKTLNGVGYHHC